MTKHELIKVLAFSTGIAKDDVSTIVESTMLTIKEHVEEGGSVCLRGFGTFAATKRKEKKARNITAGTMMVIPERTVPTFKPSKQFKCHVK